MKVEVTDGMKYTIGQITGYLASRGIPKEMLRQIRLSLTYDAVTQSNEIKYDRIFAGIALMLHRTYGFGQDRIIRGLKSFDEIVGSVLDDAEDRDWKTIMEELKEETKIAIRTGDDNRLICESCNSRRKE